MPYQAVARDEHVVLLAEADEGIGIAEAELSLAGLQVHALHAVFGYDGVEVAGDDIVGQAVAPRQLPGAERGTDVELIGQGRLEGGLDRLMRSTGGEEQEQGEEAFHSSCEFVSCEL